MVEIGKALGISHAAVSKHLKKVQARWQSEQVDNLAATRLRELAKIDETEREAWLAWERSKRDAEERRKLVQEEDEGEDGGIVTKITTEEKHKGQCGDPRYLEVICKCREQRAKLYGLYSDVNIHVGDNVVNVWDAVSEEPGNVVVIEEQGNAG